MSNINISVTEQDPINVSIASPEVQNVDVTGQSISATVSDGDKGDIVVTGNGTVWTLDPNALATRVPYTGATSDVNLGEFGLLTGNLEFDTTPTNAPTGAGSMVWNDTEGTVDLVLKGGNLVLPIGQKQTIRAVNGTGGNLTRAQYRAVKITGAQGQRLQVSLARADNDANSKDTIGIVGEDISNNQTGFIVSSGLIEEINTTGSLQGETWADGDTLYLSGTTYGVITNIKPAAPIHTVILGFVVYAHANHGKIYVKVDNGYELDELHNVNVSTAASGDYLRYNGTTWVDATISAADLPTGIDAAKIATGTVSNTEFGYLDGVTSAIQTQINSKQATLSLTTTGTSGAATLVGATLNIPQYQAVLTNPVTGTGASGQVSFFNGTSTVTGDNGLFWDNTNKRLGVGTTSPAYKSEVRGNIASIQTAAVAGYQNGIILTDLTTTTVALGLQSTSGASLPFLYGNSGLGFGTAVNERMRLTAAGRLLIGTTTESTYLLDVAGTARVTGDLNVNGLTAGKGNTSVSNATAFGVSALSVNTGDRNTAFGWNALPVVTTGIRNTAVGPEALYVLVSGSNNVVIGHGAAGSLVSGSNNTAVGQYSLAFATGSNNTAIGQVSLYNITSGANNTAIGYSSGRFTSGGLANATSTNSTYIGYDTRSSADGNTNEIVIGYTAVGNGNNTVTLGNTSITKTILQGNVGVAQTTFGTSATNTFAIASGVAPTTSPADAFQLYSADITAGNAAPHFRTEGGAVVKLYQQTTGVGAATFVANTGTAVNDASTFDGYTLNQIVKALRNAGFLA